MTKLLFWILVFMLMPILMFFVMMSEFSTWAMQRIELFGGWLEAIAYKENSDD